MTHQEVVHLIAVPGKIPSIKPLGRLSPGLLCSYALRKKLVPHGRVLLIGDQSCEQSASSMGLHIHQRFAPPLGEIKLLKRQIKHEIGNARTVYCWNDELFPLSRGIQADRILTSTAPLLAKPRMPSKQATVWTLNSRDQKLWIDRGIDAQVNSDLLRLFSKPQSKTDRAPGTECTLRIGVISDSPSKTDARELAFLMGLLNAAGHSLTGVIPTTATHIPAARRHHRGLGSIFQFITAELPITSLLESFDLCIHPTFDQSGASKLIEYYCEQSGVPILRLNQSTRAGLSRAPGVAGPIIEKLDQLRNQLSQTSLQQTEMLSYAK